MLVQIYVLHFWRLSDLKVLGPYVDFQRTVSLSCKPYTAGEYLGHFST